MKKNLPIGVSDFKDMIEKNYYYFDKTNFIKNILEDGSKVKLFTRPRRFGKTLNLSMIKYFFDIEEKEENRKLFKNLKISESEYFEKQGTAPVISISFRNYAEKNWENGFDTIKGEIKDLYNQFYFIRENLNQSDLEEFDRIWLEKDNAKWKNALFNLSRYLYEYYGERVVILIDEYDQPIIDSYIKGYYEDTIDFFKTFYGKVLKDNKYLEIGIISGILRVAKENIFSGLNHLEVHTILDDEFTEYFGFVEDEVEKSLKDFNLEYELNEVQKWYNGYLFGDKKVYNPWSIINFLKQGKLKPYWVNTSGNELIRMYLEQLKDSIFEDFSTLLNKEEILEIINDSMTFGNLEANFEKNIWNLFFHSGYLTLAREYDVMKKSTSLKIPNKEILEMFSDMFIEVYFRNSSNFLKLTNALKNGDVEKFKLELNKILLENVGIFDVNGIYKEQFYHGLILGIILMLKNEYEITSNNFAGKGRYDLLLKPKNLENRKEGIILELKIVNSKENFSESEIQRELEKGCDIALKQIEDKKYASVLKNAGIDSILKIGMEFFGKEMEIKFEREIVEL